MATYIRFPAKIERRLTTLAKRTGRTKTFHIREIILAHLEETENYYLAAEVADRVRTGRECTIRAQELRHALALTD